MHVAAFSCYRSSQRGPCFLSFCMATPTACFLVTLLTLGPATRIPWWACLEHPMVETVNVVKPVWQYLQCSGSVSGSRRYTFYSRWYGRILCDPKGEYMDACVWGGRYCSGVWMSFSPVCVRPIFQDVPFRNWSIRTLILKTQNKLKMMKMKQQFSDSWTPKPWLQHIEPNNFIFLTCTFGNVPHPYLYSA